MKLAPQLGELAPRAARPLSSWLIVFGLFLPALDARGEQTPSGKPLVPGCGVKITTVGDDFEDADWRYAPNGPKASANIDDQVREPIGVSSNGRIFESTYRGHPDVVRRVSTPDGGIPGSRGALLMRSRATGVPGRVSNEQQQDDLMVNVYGVLDHEIEPRYAPSCTVRVYVPAWDKWEQRSGSSFGFRLDCEAYGRAPAEGLLTTRRRLGWHQYWPGMFLVLRREEDGYDRTHVQVLIRADRTGQDVEGPLITKPGWYTFGMSVARNGEVHYFLRRGVDDLKPEDHIASFFPYGLACDKFNLIFFNVVNREDGRSWSTPWIIDDPAVYYIPDGWSLADVDRFNAKHAQAVETDSSTFNAKDASVARAIFAAPRVEAGTIGDTTPSRGNQRSRWMRDKSFKLRR